MFVAVVGAAGKRLVGFRICMPAISFAGFAVVLRGATALLEAPLHGLHRKVAILFALREFSCEQLLTVFRKCTHLLH